VNRLQHSQVVPEQTERHQGRHLELVDLQSVGYQAERGFGEIEEDQGSQRSETFLGTQGERSEDKVYWQNWKNIGSHKEEVIAYRGKTTPLSV
jgi:hypothetical protein